MTQDKHFQAIAEAMATEEELDYDQLKTIDPDQAIALKSAFKQNKKMMLSKLEDIQEKDEEYINIINNQLDDEAVSRIFAEIPEIRQAFEKLQEKFENMYEVMFLVSSMLEESMEFNELAGGHVHELEAKNTQTQKTEKQTADIHTSNNPGNMEENEAEGFDLNKLEDVTDNEEE